MSVDSGYAKRIINPPLPTPLTGYGIYLERNAESIHDDLYLRLALFRFENGSKLCIAGFDLIGFDSSTAERLRRAISRAVDSTRDSVLLACTHTHSGPPSMSLRGMGTPDPRYIELLIDRAESAALEAASSLAPSTLDFVKEPIEPLGYNRTSNDFRGIDPNLSLLSATPEDGKEGSIVIANYALHPVLLGINREVSADVPGAFCRLLETRGARPIFLQGFCGDIDPVINLSHWGEGGYRETERYATHLAERVERVRERAETLTRPALETQSSHLSLPFDPADALPKYIDQLTTVYEGYGRGFDRFVEEVRADWVAIESGESVELPMQLIRITSAGRPIEFIALGAEVFAYFSLAISLSTPESVPIPVGYANGNIGYIPDEPAFDRAGDYAAYLAPFIYRRRPLSRDTPSLLIAHIDLMRGIEPLSARNG